MNFAPIPSPEETVRLYRAGELAAELARYHETAAEDERPFVAQCIRLHNNGEIDLLAVASTPAFGAIQGPNFFVAQNFYCKAIPGLRADLRSVMVCCSALIKQAGRDYAANIPNDAFQQWCAANPEKAQTVIQEARLGDELARQFATFALRSLDNLDGAIGFIEDFADDRRLIGMAAVAGIRYADSLEVQRAIAALERFVVVGTDDNVRSNALLAAFKILEIHPDAAMATALLSAAAKEAGPGLLYALAQVVWLHHKQLDSEPLSNALRTLRSVPTDNPDTINNLDMALHSLLGTANENLALDCLTDLLRDCRYTLASFSTTASAVSRGNPQRRYALVMRWLLSGSLPLCSNVGDLLGVEKDRPFDATAATLGLTAIEQIFVSRKAVGFLFIKPVACCSIIVSVLRTASTETVEPLTELLFF